MAALVGCGQRSIIHSRKNDARSSRNEFQDFHRSFRAQQLYRASPRPPRRPQPSATSCRPTSSGREPFSSHPTATQLATPSQTMTLYTKESPLDRRTFASSVGKFCDAYSWRTLVEAKKHVHLAPDVSYRYTYGTTDWNRSSVNEEVELPSRKPSAQTIVDDLSGQPTSGWDVSKHLELLTKRAIEPRRSPVGLDGSRKKPSETAGRAANRLSTPRKLGGPPRTNANLYGKVRTSIELFRALPESGGSPRTTPKTKPGSDYGYHRDKSKRGKSVAMLDYLQDSGWSTLRRSQTAPISLEAGDRELSSADAYLQYVEQQRTGKPSRRPLPARKTFNDVMPTARMPKSSTPAASIRAPPVTPRSWDSDVRNVRSSSNTTAATSSARCAFGGTENRPEGGAASGSTVASRCRPHRKDAAGSESLREKGWSAHSEKRLDDVITNENETGDGSRSAVSASRREMLTVDLRSAVGDATGEV